jgi:hypothetical protein
MFVLCCIRTIGTRATVCVSRTVQDETRTGVRVLLCCVETEHWITNNENIILTNVTPLCC